MTYPGSCLFPKTRAFTIEWIGQSYAVWHRHLRCASQDLLPVKISFQDRLPPQYIFHKHLSASNYTVDRKRTNYGTWYRSKFLLLNERTPAGGKRNTWITLCAADLTLLLRKLTSTFSHDTRLSPCNRRSENSNRSQPIMCSSAVRNKAWEELNNVGSWVMTQVNIWQNLKHIFSFPSKKASPNAMKMWRHGKLSLENICEAPRVLVTRESWWMDGIKWWKSNILQ